jgi:hypothetical protein
MLQPLDKGGQVCHDNSMENQINLTYAVQPATWLSLDPQRAMWALDLEDARSCAHLLGQHCLLWVAPVVGKPYALMHL